ncbi:MAG: hypothetical protein F6K58_26910 [Symploca sp. SIO2E9]|nr:hypothetical protein [Symploca sp. SIO2E9]
MGQGVSRRSRLGDAPDAETLQMRRIQIPRKISFTRSQDFKAIERWKCKKVTHLQLD